MENFQRVSMNWREVNDLNGKKNHEFRYAAARENLCCAITARLQIDKATHFVGSQLQQIQIQKALFYH